MSSVYNLSLTMIRLWALLEYHAPNVVAYKEIREHCHIVSVYYFIARLRKIIGHDKIIRVSMTGYYMEKGE